LIPERNLSAIQYVEEKKTVEFFLKRSNLIPILNLVLVWCCLSPALCNDVRFSQGLYQQHLEVLGSDRLQGRGTGTEGELMAARYLAQMLRNSGIQTALPNGSFFQQIPMHGSRVLDESNFQLYTPSDSLTYHNRKDFLVENTGNLQLHLKPVEMVFAGYGIIAPEHDYNDYQSLDVRGKIVIYLDGEPSSEDEAYFDGPEPSIYSFSDSKRRIALSRGAVGSVLISGSKTDGTWDKQQLAYGFEEVKLAYSPTSLLNILVPFEVAENFFQGAQLTLEQVQLLDKREDMRSFPLVSRFRFNGKYAERDFVARNVIGFIPGLNKRYSDEYLLLTAHYDHLGIGPPMNGDSIYNGVFDNAAGVAALLEIGRMIAQKPLERSVLLVFVSGEERGLLGSLYYVDHPVRPLHRALANINIDGISMFEPFREVIGVGGEMSSLGSLLTSFTAKSGIQALGDSQVKNAQSLFTRSDQIVFARAGIPSILVIEGNAYQSSDPQAGQNRMKQWVKNIYHTPFDDLSQPINYAAVEQHVMLLKNFLRSVAAVEQQIEWKPGIPYRVERFRSRAENR